MKGKILLGKLLTLITDQVNQERLDALAYQQEEIRVLKSTYPKLKFIERLTVQASTENLEEPRQAAEAAGLSQL